MDTKCLGAIENEDTIGETSDLMLNAMNEKGKGSVDDERNEEDLVWSECPDHILERMFSTLQLEFSTRFRMVCKEWNMLLSSSKFLSLLPERDPWILLCSETHAMAFCFLTQSWKTISLSFLPGPIAGNLAEAHSRFANRSGAGLLVLEITQPQKTYKICNPLTGMYKDIPGEIAEKVSVAGIMDNGESYKIVGVPNVEDPSSIKIYHFSEMSWRVEVELLLPEDYFEFSYICCAKGLLVCISVDRKLVVWNMETKQAQPVSFPDELFLDINLWHVQLVLCGSSILIVLIYLDFDPDPYAVNSHVNVWELFQDERSKWSWREISRMPSAMCQKLVKAGFPTVTSPNFECRSAGVGDFLCLAGGHSNTKLFVYSLRERCWTRIKLPQSVRFNRYHTVLDFQPNLGMKV